ncbi:hypothetical protein F5B19DRAFT_479279 [Rostrohypoxylon terebratum]|nr:hypothetical protein F5B19DRAFT_479279 [Rostrohypoxylon terebratum]
MYQMFRLEGTILFRQFDQLINLGPNLGSLSIYNHISCWIFIARLLMHFVILQQKVYILAVDIFLRMVVVSISTYYCRRLLETHSSTP